MVKLNGIDITQYVDIQSIITNDTLDESLASGAFVIPFISSTEIINGDQPIPRFTQVDIDGILFVVSEDIVKLVKKGTDKRYRHEISLIEPTKILQKRVIPNLTVTQPQGDIANYYLSINRLSSPVYTVDNIQTTLPIVTTSESQNTTVIEGTTLKNLQPYEIVLNYTIENRQQDTTPTGQTQTNAEAEIEFEVYYGSSLIATKTVYIQGRPNNIFDTDPIVHIGGFKIDYTPTVTTQDITVKARTLGLFTIVGDDTLHITDLSLVINQSETVDDKYYLDQVVDKLLAFHPEFQLAPETRARISQILSPEFTFQNYTLYDALKEVANYATAIVYLGEQDFTTIHFYFYDQDLPQTIDITDETQTEYLDGYADGLEINASNVIRDDNQLYAVYEPDTFGWISVRSSSEERGEQIVDTNTALHLQQPIYRPIQIRVKGLEFTMKDELNNDVVFPATQIWDITDYLVEQQRYNIQTTEANLNNRGATKNKANTIYYRQGDNKIYGLGYIGTLPPAWNQPNPPNYAIWEAILNKAAEENPTYTFTTDYLINLVQHSIHDLQFRVRHIPYSDVRLTLYKDQNRGNNIIYYNEQANLNDMELLGRIGQENANRTGNRTVRYEGLTGNNQLLLGSKIGDKVLVNYTISRTPTVNKFVAEYAVGYSNISNYVGIDSAYRQYEVPQDTIVNRKDKKTQFFDLRVSDTVPDIIAPNYIQTDHNYFFNSLFGNFESNPSGARPTYAKITTDNQLIVESNIDAYRMGRTIGLAFDMLDNWSAGITKQERQIYNGSSNITIKTQEDARYTDLLGRFETATIEFWNASGSSLLASSDNYPDNNTTPVYKYIDYTYTVNKDARERYGFIWEIVIHGDTQVRVYDGFIKYNRLASELTPTPVEIRFLEKGYNPDRNLDITRTVLGTGTTDVPPGEKYLRIQATAPVGEYEGLILTLNEEPILSIISGDYDFGTQVTKYIYPEAFKENDFQLGVEDIVTFIATAIGDIIYTAPAEGSTVQFTATATGVGQENQEAAADSTTVQFNGQATGSIFLEVSEPAESTTVEFNGTATGQGQLFYMEAAETNTVDFTANATGSIYMSTSAAADSTTVQFNATATGSTYVEFSGAADSSTVQFNGTATGQSGHLVQGFVVGYDTLVQVNFSDQQTNYSQILYGTPTFIRNAPSGVTLTITAPSSYAVGNTVYVFNNWRVLETGLTEYTTNRTLVTTINQNKTLRAEYDSYELGA